MHPSMLHCNSSEQIHCKEGGWCQNAVGYHLFLPLCTFYLINNYLESSFIPLHSGDQIQGSVFL